MGNLQDESIRTLIQKKTLFLINELFTYRIEAECNKQIIDMSEEELEEIGEMGSKKLKIPQEDDNGRLVFEFTDASYILTQMLSKSAVEKYLDYLISRNSENDDFNADEVSQILLQEELLRDKIRVDRNSFQHETTLVDEKTLTKNISAVIAYIMYLRELRLLIWEQYDPDRILSNDWKYRRLDEIENSALELNNLNISREISGEGDEAVSYKFNGRIYTIDTEQSAAFNLLITDMARYWYDGIEYIKADTKDSLDAFVEARFGDNKELRAFRIFKDEIRQVRMDEIQYDLESNISYMQLLYTLNPMIGAFYWKGRKLTESEFASKVLQTLTRHDKENTFRDKIGTLEYRVTHFPEWDSTNDKKPGIGIDLVKVCKKGILTAFFVHKENKKSQAQLAKSFENTIVSISQHKLIRERENYKDVVVEHEADYDWYEENYDSMMRTIYELIGSMKSEQTYRDMNGTIFKTQQQFIDYALLNSGGAFSSLNELQTYLKKVGSDSGFRFWIEHSRG